MNGAFKVARIHSLPVLEAGSYWPALRPHFSRPEFQRIRYAIHGKSTTRPEGQAALSVRGASKAGEFEVAFVSDHLAAEMAITGDGLPDYCLTLVDRGRLTFTDRQKGRHDVDPTIGLIYRGTPEVRLVSDGPQARVALWIPRASIQQRLSAMLGAPVDRDVEFEPVFDWTAPSSANLLRLFRLLLGELKSRQPMVLGNPLADRAFCDLFIYTLLHSLSHDHLHEIGPRTTVSPKILRQAESYIRANVEEPISLHDVADAAGCSVRCLQLAFRKFRNTTPLLAIRQFRLDAARDVLHAADPSVTVTSVAHQFGFSNPGRFKRFYEAAFGESPTAVMGRRRG